MPRRPLSPLPLPGAALLLFALALLEVGNRLELFPGVGIAVLAGLSAAAVLLGLLRRSGGLAGGRRLATALAGSALVAFGCRAFLGIETSPGPGAAPAAIDRVDGWLAEVTREIGDAARLLARAPNIAAAVEGSDAGDPRTGAFRALSEWPLPGTAIGRAGATLYDRGLRPVAWSGRSPALEAALARFFPEGVRAEDCPAPAVPLFLYTERGRRGYLAAAGCTRHFLGLVTVELPVLEIPPPSSGAPPRSALETAAGRGLETQLLRDTDDPAALARLFEQRGERFLDGPFPGRRHYFALRAHDGQLLGAASTVVAPEPARRQERRAEAALIAALALLAGGLAAAPALWRTGIAGALAAIWTVVFGLSAALANLPSGLGPGFPESPSGVLPELPGAPDSPLAALLAAAALFLSVRVLHPLLRRRPEKRRPGASAPRFVARFAPWLRGGAAGAAAVAAAAVVGGAGDSGAIPLAPTWRVGIGWPEVFGWTALLLVLGALALVGAVLLRRRTPAVVSAFAVVAGSALITSERAFLFAAIPVAATALLVSWRRGRLALRRLRRPLLSHEPGFSFVIALLLFALPPVLWYPAMHWREEQARRRYAAEAVPVQALRHGFTVCHALGEATRALDAGAARLDPLGPETAYQLWLSTGLPRLTAASAIEVREPGGRVSRFGVRLSRRPDPPASTFAPVEWSAIPDCPGGPGDTGDAVLATTRRYPSGHRVVVQAAVRTREIPFLPQARGIADHFLLRGDAAPAVFREKDLRLDRGAPGVAAPADPNRIEIPLRVRGAPLTVSWRRANAGDVAAALLGWVFLAAMLALGIAAAARARLVVPGRGGRARRRSFQMQLTETLAAAVLVAIFGLAAFAQQRLSALLESASDREALARSRAVQRVAGELGGLDPTGAPEDLASRLAHAADQLDTDAALYAGAELIAVSRSELAQTGLLPPRPPAAAVMAPGGRSAPVFSVQEAGPLRYRIIWLPLDGITPTGAATFLAVPLPAGEAERIAGVRALQRTLLFGSGGVALVFAILLPAFLARRLAAPVRSLARATGRIADGELGTPVPVHALAELRLLAAGVERLVRRIPSVRRRMREEAKADLTRRVAHDIKNALAPIGLAADYIRRVLRDPRGQDRRAAVEESVGDILGQVERLRRISSEFSALGAPLRIETVDPAKLVRDTVAPYLRAQTGPQVSFDAAGVPKIQADPEIVARIVENLLQNALEAVGDSLPGAEADGSITVRVRGDAARSRVRIEVEDDGPGVPAELRERIFDAAFSTRTRGSGLGLANARRFAEAHAGNLGAGARADGRRGLLVTLHLPVEGPAGGRRK